MPDQVPAVRQKVSVVTGEFERDRRQGPGGHPEPDDESCLQDIPPASHETQQRVLDRLDADDLRPGPPPHHLPMERGAFPSACSRRTGAPCDSLLRLPFRSRVAPDPA